MERQKIAEEMRLQDKWYEEARYMKPEKFQDFFRHLSEDYEHDYGTVCHAMAAIGLAAMWAFNNSDGARGGITGFQSGIVLWQVIKEWEFRDNECGLRLQDMDNLLYPQYAYHFNSISQRQWTAVQEKARKCIEENKKNGTAHPDIVEHWKSIVNGIVPFGLHIRGEKE